MLSMTATPMMTQPVYVGIDTHKATHHAAIIDADGHVLADAQFDSGPDGDAELLDWLADREVTAVGVEQTGSYGAGLTRSLQRAGHRVVEVNSPDLAVRARVGKSDPIDAVMAANAVRSGRATAIPKQRTGVVESIRLIQVTRDSAVKSRTTALTQIQSLLIIAPDELRAQFGPTPTATQIVARARRWRADRTRLHQPTQAAKLALGRLARRIDDLGQEITGYDIALRELTAQAAPRLLALPQVGPVTAAQLLVTVGQAPTGSPPTPNSPDSAASPRSRPPRAPPAGCACTAAVTAKPTKPSTSSPSAGCVTTSRPSTTCNAEPPKAWPKPTSSEP